MNMTIQVNYAATGCLPDSDNYPYEIQVEDHVELINIIKDEVYQGCDDEFDLFDTNENEIEEVGRQIIAGEVDSWPIPAKGRSTYILEFNVINEERAFDL